jgi:hypothetical protein
LQPLLQWEINEYYTTWVSVFAALGTQHAMRIHHVLCDLPRFCNILPHYPINSTIFEQKKNVFESKTSVSSFFTTFVPNIFHSKKK